jgi:hypothetical protein
MSVFRFGDDKWAEHHFEINPQTNEINIWDKWLTKGNAIFGGQYELQNDKLVSKDNFSRQANPLLSN